MMNRRFAVSMTMSLLLAGPALAQRDADPEDLLRGPAVEDRTVPGVRSTFGEGSEMNPRREIPQQVFIRLIRQLDSDEAPEDLRPTPRQLEAIRAILREFEEDTREFRREYGREARELRRRLSESDRAGTPPKQLEQRPMRRPDGSPMSDDAMTDEAARDRARVLREMAPSAAATQTRIWEVLTAPQQDHLREEFRKWEEQVVTEQMAQRLSRQTGREVDPDTLRRPGRNAPEGEITFDDLQKRIESLPPDMQRIVLRRLYEQLDPQRLERMRERMVPPDIDSVDVPTPDQPRRAAPRDSRD